MWFSCWSGVVSGCTPIWGKTLFFSHAAFWELNNYGLGRGWCRYSGVFCHWYVALYKPSLQHQYLSISLQYCLWCFIQGSSLQRDLILIRFRLVSVHHPAVVFLVKHLLFFMNSFNISLCLVPPTQLLPTFSLTPVPKNTICIWKNRAFFNFYSKNVHIEQDRM